MEEREYPRPLAPREREFLEWVLPSDRAGYRTHRELIATLSVIGEGRRGEGEIILGAPGDTPDFSAPLPAVLAYGMIETDHGTISVTVREMLDNQVSVEIVGHGTETVPEQFTERRRWTYSTWRPGERCPQCGQALREVTMHAPGGKSFDLAICANDRKIWFYNGETEVVHLIPVTNFHNELMLHKNIRDPKVALDPKRLFSTLGEYTDADLTYAFLTYNKLRPKVILEQGVEAETKDSPTLISRVAKLFRP
ncbi:MAG TPA: hypothetical protein VKS81_11970 [Bacteroidota bacterium]|nr:hypothetical protein [Bacteroidota bacterium]